MLTVDPPFPAALTKETIAILYKSFRPVVKVSQVRDPTTSNKTVTLLHFETAEQGGVVKTKINT